MRRRIAGVLAGGALLLGAGGAAAAYEVRGGDHDDRSIVVSDDAPRSQSGAPDRVVVEDGIGRAEARRLMDAATQRVPGSPVSVQREDGGAQVEVRERDGRLVDVRLDRDLRTLDVDRD